MATPNSTIVRQRGDGKTIDPRTEAENRFDGFTVLPGMKRKPEYWIYVFNIGAKAWVDDAHGKLAIRRPPLMPCVSIPGCPKSSKYVVAFRVPDIIRQGWQDEVTGGLRIHEEYGERVVMDIINPVNPGIDQDLEIDPNVQAFASGFNLGEYGVFFSKNEEPTDEEMDKARKRMEKRYRALLAEADELERAGERKRITADHYLAADYFDYKSGWRTRAEAPSACPVCGSSMKAGAAFHVLDGGGLCINDWKRVVAAGVRKREDVPEELRWWEEEEKKPARKI